MGHIFVYKIFIVALDPFVYTQEHKEGISLGHLIHSLAYNLGL